MELTYTTEKSEKETVRLFLRQWGFLRDLRLWSAILSVGWLVGTIFYCFVLLDPFYSPCKCAVSALLGSGIFLVCFFLLDRMLVQAPRRAYRQRKTHKIEYRLTDDGLAFTIGETQFSSPWNNVAKKFRVDKKALYLYGRNLPFEVQCIPDWQGHGVERKEFVAALKKAGLKKAMSGRLKFLIWLVASPVVLAALLTIYFYIGGIEWGDWTIPNEAELRLELRDIPDEENAYVALTTLTNLYTVAGNDQENEKSDGDSSQEISDNDFVKYYGDPFNSEDGAKRTEVRRNPASPKRAEKILADNAKFFDAFQAALSREKFCNNEWLTWHREVKIKRQAAWSPFNPYLPDYRWAFRFTQLVALRGQAALENGDIETAVSAMRSINSLGQKVLSSPCTMLDYQVGIWIKKNSYRKMCDAVAMARASDANLEIFRKVLDADDANAASCFARALRADMVSFYLQFIEWLRDADGDSVVQLYDQMYPDLGDESRLTGLQRLLWRWPGYFRFAVHRRETIFRLAEVVRAVLANGDLPEHLISETSDRAAGYVRWLVPNWRGADWRFLPLAARYFKEDTMNRIRPRLVIAAEKWRRAHGGENPPTLDALAPDYLAGVPRDPWSKSGTPIQYDALTGVAWSVGKDGKYDYRKGAKDIKSAAVDSSADGDTQKYAFRLDGKPIVFTSLQGGAVSRK